MGFGVDSATCTAVSRDVGGEKLEALLKQVEATRRRRPKTRVEPEKR